MPMLQLDGSDIENKFWVRAVMLFPNDLHAAQMCFAVEKVKAITDGDSDNEKRMLDVRTIRLLLDAPSYVSLKKTIAENTKRAMVAGDVLSALYVMDRFNVPEPSMNKAIFAAKEYAKKARYGDDTPLPISEPTIRNCWEDFRVVAHLWAADRLGQVYPFAPDPLSLESWAAFLEAAQGIFEFGKTYIPKRSRSKKSILDGDDYWVLPKVIQASHLQTQRKPDALLKLLKNYKAPKTRV